MTDIEINHQSKKESILNIAKKLGLTKEDLVLYGSFMAKINLKRKIDSKKGHLILVTSINPTPAGEGKTTMSIGIDDALCKLGKNSIVVLREPSMGPVFGLKGGATGGGYAQVSPMEDINLHFTGDMHALTSANDLLCAAIDNYIYQGNEIGINPETIQIPRALDINDRALRRIKLDNRNDHFVITVASELMAILCLSNDLMDLKKRIGHILVGYTFDHQPVYVHDLGFEGALTVILKDAIKPNLAQTLENNPAIIHGGPFANIAHGCNSLIATRLALNLADYVVTEAGFGADLGAEKFLDIKCPVGNIKPSCMVINATIRSLKYNGGVSLKELDQENMASLEQGSNNLKIHIENMLKYTKNVVVCINQMKSDTLKEIEFLKEFTKNFGVEAIVSKAFLEGGKGSLELANKIVEICQRKIDYRPLYSFDSQIEDKIWIIAKEIYRADHVEYSKEAKESIKKIEQLKLNHLPVCIAKTQYSLSDDAKSVGVTSGFTMHVKDIQVSSGAGFIVVYMGNIMTMPGLNKHPALLDIDIDENENIIGLF